MSQKEILFKQTKKKFISNKPNRKKFQTKIKKIN